MQLSGQQYPQPQQAALQQLHMQLQQSHASLPHQQQQQQQYQQYQQIQPVQLSQDQKMQINMPLNSVPTSCGATITPTLPDMTQIVTSILQHPSAPLTPQNPLTPLPQNNLLDQRSLTPQVQQSLPLLSQAPASQVHTTMMTQLGHIVTSQIQQTGDQLQPNISVSMSTPYSNDTTVVAPHQFRSPSVPQQTYTRPINDPHVSSTIHVPTTSTSEMDCDVSQSPLLQRHTPSPKKSPSPFLKLDTALTASPLPPLPDTATDHIPSSTPTSDVINATIKPATPVPSEPYTVAVFNSTPKKAGSSLPTFVNK